MARVCLFCGAPADSAEHVMPEWVGRLFGADYYELRRTADPTEEPRRTTEPDLRVRRVCTRCNNGWMSDLETAASVILGPLILGEPARLPPVHQRLIAVWAVKFAMLLPYSGSEKGPRDHFTVEDGEPLRLHQMPPPGVLVWIARFAGGRMAQFAIEELFSGPPRTPGVPRAYVLSVHIGQLAFQMLATRPTETLGQVPLRGAWSRSTVPVFPMGIPYVKWPPPEPLDADAFVIFSDRWGPATKPDRT